MKGKRLTALTAALVALVLLATPARADLFGGDLPLLTSILIQLETQVQQITQQIQIATQSYQYAQQVGALLTNPGGWKYRVQGLIGSLSHTVSTGHDVQTIQNFTAIMDASDQAMQSAMDGMGDTPNAQGVLLLGQLQMQQLSAKREQDRLNEELTDLTAIQLNAAQGVGIGPVSQSAHWVPSM